VSPREPDDIPRNGDNVSFPMVTDQRIQRVARKGGRGPHGIGMAGMP
jgi:hypothetical protein